MPLDKSKFIEDSLIPAKYSISSYTGKVKKDSPLMSTPALTGQKKRLIKTTDTFTVLEEHDEWVLINFALGKNGYSGYLPKISVSEVV